MIYKLHYHVLVFTMHGKEHKNQLKLIKSKKKEQDHMKNPNYTIDCIL